MRLRTPHCALARALDVVGDRWSMLIVRNLLLGPRRWKELRADLPGVAKNLLAARLQRMQDDGLLEHDGERYRLSSAGRALEPALFALADWGERHVLALPRPGDAVRMRYLLTSMRRRLRPTTQEARLGLRVGGEEATVVLGPTPAVVQGIEEGVCVWEPEPLALVGLLRGGEPPEVGAALRAALSALQAAWPPA